MYILKVPDTPVMALSSANKLRLRLHGERLLPQTAEPLQNERALIPAVPLYGSIHALFKL
ncbi:MAG: hypothetical protein BCS36_13755 [Desulfovibrio sp. MES5]|nr:MAG: hypothetical protein BCS36_13755 [Desulfovibrio sp. MES5]